MKIPTTPRAPKARRAIVVGALSVLTLGGFGVAYATSAGAATPTAGPVITPSAITPSAESTSAKDTDTLQQGDQTGPDTTGADESGTK